MGETYIAYALAQHARHECYGALNRYVPRPVDELVPVHADGTDPASREPS